MSKKSSYDIDQFRSLIMAGKTKIDIIKEMGIKGYAQFASLELRLFKKDKKYYQIAEPEPLPQECTITIGSKKNIVIPTKFLKGKLEENDKYKISFEKKSIVLTLIEDVEKVETTTNEKDHDKKSGTKEVSKEKDKKEVIQEV